MGVGLLEEMLGLSWADIIKDLPSMLPKTEKEDYELKSIGVLTPSKFEEYKSRVLSIPLP